MREIKFRAWDTRVNKWYKSVNDPLSWSNWNNEEVSYTVCHIPEGVVLMQYTGLKDKNGKEIFEGDVISLIRCPKRHFSCMCEKKPDPSFTGQVIFKNGCFICAEVENSISEYVVIGNIYENPPITGEKGEV